jgi:putative glutamine amidotransferase
MSSLGRAPLIGITADSESPKEGANNYSKYPWYAIRENYCGAVRAAGGVPLVLPHETSLVARYAALLDGLLVSGGAFDVDPTLFGADSRHDTVVLKEGRTDFELGITRAMLTADKPLLGICGGQQLLAVVLGGTLIQHIPDEVQNPLAHEQPNPRHQAGHEVTITEGSLLHRITGVTTASVNSAHHQAVKAVPPNIVIGAVAPDGVIEGIEDPSRAFCIGVQWHPEFHISPADERLFQAFIDAAQKKMTP